MRQLKELRHLYGPDLVNYNALFLGEHDALNASKDLILFAAQQAYDILEFSHSVMKQPRTFLFGSVDSLLNADMSLFEALNRQPFDTFINIGLESHDPATLERIGKPITAEKVSRAFDRMCEINQAFAHIEMTGNFIMDDGLPPPTFRPCWPWPETGFPVRLPKAVSICLRCSSENLPGKCCMISTA